MHKSVRFNEDVEILQPNQKITVFQWKNICSHKVEESEVKYRSHVFYEYESRHNWFLELVIYGSGSVGIRLCLVVISPKIELLVEFTLYEHENNSSVPITSSTFQYSSTKLKSALFAVPSGCEFTKGGVWFSLEFNRVIRRGFLPSEKDCKHNILEDKNQRELRIKNEVGKVQNQRDFLSFLRNSKLHDITIAVEGKEIKCHKSVLCWRSPYFDAMFKSGLTESKENQIKIIDFDYETIEAMTTFLYTFECPKLTTRTAKSILRAADKYQVPDLKDICEKYLITEMNASNAMDILLYADIHSAQQIKKRAIKFIWDNFGAFVEPEQYEPLMSRPDLFRELMLVRANAFKKRQSK